MERWYDLKKEIDEELGDVKFTREMKNCIIQKCREETITTRFRLKGCHPVIFGILVFFMLSGVIMAMDYVLGLRLFFSEENLNKISSEIKNVQMYSEDNDVKLVVEEMIIQPYSSLITLSFINQRDEVWTEGVKSESLDISWRGGFSRGPGVLSEDGKRLSYCIEVSSQEKIEDSLITVKAENLIQTKRVNKSIQIPLDDFYEAQYEVLDSRAYDSSNELFYKLLERINEKKNQKQVILDSMYSSVYLIGAGFLINDEISAEEMQRGESGLVVYTRNDEYLGEVDWSKDAYLRGSIQEIVDTRTGEIYEATEISLLVTGAKEGGVSASYFPNIQESQIPYLQATKAVYEKQEVVVEGNWEISFEVEENKNIIGWKPDIKWEDGEDITYIDEVYLGTMGVQIKMHSINTRTHEIKGDITELEVEVITNQGKVVSLKRYRGMASRNANEELEGYILMYNIFDQDGNGEFLDIDSIQEIAINGYRLEVPIT